MGLIEIINNFLIPKKAEIQINLSNETINKLMQISELHKIGNTPIYLHGLFPPYDDFIFNPYFQLITCIIGAMAIQELFDILLWPYIRDYRNKFYRWILSKIRK